MIIKNLKSLYLQWVIPITTSVLVASCGNVSTPEVVPEIEFNGITSVQSTSSPGSFVITWKKAGDVPPIDSYEIYIQEVEQDSSSTQDTNIGVLSTESGDDSTSFTKIIEKPDQGAPVKLGKLHTIAKKAENSAQIDNIQPGNYIAQVRAVSVDGTSDKNQKTIVFTRGQDQGFGGLQLVEVAGNKARLTWLPWFGSFSGFKYQVFKGEAFNESIAVVEDTTYEYPLDGLAAGSKIHFGVRVLFDDGTLDKNTNLVSLTVPTDTNQYLGCLSAKAIGYDRVKLEFEWPEFRQYDRIDILRNGARVFQTADPSQTEFIDKGLKEGHNYYYNCQAVFDKEFKIGENQLRVQTLSTNAPTFEGVKLVELQNGALKIHWGVATEIPPTHFLLYGNAGDQVDWSRDPLKQLEPFELNYELKEFGDDLKYSFGVRACNEDICDSNDVSASISSPDQGPPKTQPISEVVIEAGKFIITAPWTELDGGIAKRYVYYSTAATAPSILSSYNLAKTEVVSDPANPPTSFILTSISENTTYHLVVIDEDPNGSKTSKLNIESVFSGDLTPPVFSGIKDLQAGPSGSEDTSLTVVFDALAPISEDAQGAKNYYIYIREGESSSCDPTDAILHSKLSAASLAKGETSYVITDLKQRQKYAVCVKALDDYGNISENSNFLVRQTLDRSPPEFNGIETFTFDKSTSELVATWTASSSEDIGSYIINIWFDSRPSEPLLQIAYNPVDTATGVSLPSSVVPFVSEDLVAIYVNACDNADTLAGGTKNCTAYTSADKSLVQLADVNPPAGFLGIEAESNLTLPAEGQVLVKWLAPSDWSDYAGFNIYTVDTTTQELTFVKLCACSSIGCPSNPTSCLVSGLDAYRSYNFHVRAYDENNNITQLDPGISSTAKTTSDTSSPSFSSNLQASFDQSTGNINISWNSATDNQYSTTENPGILNYFLYSKSGSVFSNVLDPSADGDLVTQIPDNNYLYSEGLSSGVTYYYSVCAEDASANRRCDGNVRSVAVPDLVPPTIDSFASSKTGDDIEWSLSWTATDNATATASIFSRLYKSSSSTAIPNVTEQDELIVAGPNQWNTGSTLLHGAMDTDEFVHYMLVVSDSDGNKSSQIITIESKNKISVTRVDSSEGVTGGSNLIVVKGEGFYSNSKVFIGSTECPTSTYISKNFVSCSTPAQTAGSYSVTVKKYFGDSSESSGTMSSAFTYCTADSTCTKPCLNSGSWSGANFASGSGTELDPYLICTETHLGNISGEGYYKYFTLGANIDLNGSSINSIKNSGANDFRGTLDGDNYSILNFAPVVSSNYSGLFRHINSISLIEKLNILAADVDARGYDFVGVLTGLIYGVTNTNIKDVFVTGSVTGAGRYHGAIAGRVDAILQNVRVDGTFTGDTHVGGVAGEIRYYAGFWDEIYFDGSVQGLAENTTDNRHYIGGIGGVVLSYTRTNVSNVHVNATIKGTPKASRTNQSDSHRYGGIFGYATNINITNCSVRGTMAVHQRAGGIVGHQEGANGVQIDNCDVYSDFTELDTGGYHIGGLVGYHQGYLSIKNSSFHGSMILPSTHQVGGMVGVSYDDGATNIESYTVIENVTVDTAEIQGYRDVGGVVGFSEGAIIKGATAIGKISCSNVRCGMIAGQLANSSLIDSMIDPSDSSKTILTTASGSVIGSKSDVAEVGGLVGRMYAFPDNNNPGTIQNTIFSGTVEGKQSIGGAVGLGSPNLKNIEISANISGQQIMGGIIGQIVQQYFTNPDPIVAENLKFEGLIKGETLNSYIGGFVGLWAKGIYQVKQIHAHVDIQGSAYTGGLVGAAHYSESSGSVIEESYVSGKVTGVTSSGGICGDNRYLEFKNSYSTVDVTGDSNVGGICGQSGNFYTNVFSTGKVSEASSGAALGGVVGYTHPSYPGTVTSQTFWNTETSGQSTSAMGVGKTTEELKQASTWSGFSSTIWQIEDGSYPVLKWTVE